MAKEQIRTITIFSAKLQEEAQFKGEVDLNGELVFTCLETGEFIKIPAGLSTEEIKAHFAEHKEANLGQVSIAESAATLESLFEDFESETITE